MRIQEALEVCRANHHSVLVTRKRDGSPQPSPVLHGVNEQGHLVISSREPAYKVRNLRRDPRATLCVIPDGFFGRWVSVEGQASIVSLPQAMDALVKLYRSIAGEHEDWADYRAAMERERRVIIAIEPLRAGPDHAG